MSGEDSDSSIGSEAGELEFIDTEFNDERYDIFDKFTKFNCAINAGICCFAMTPNAIDEIINRPLLTAFTSINAVILWERVGTMITGTRREKTFESFALFNGIVAASSYFLVRKLIG